VTVRTLPILMAAALAAAALAPVAASARSGRGSDNGDSWLNDSVKNPRFAEPWGDNDPARYRVSHPQYGWDDRVLADQGLYNEGSGLPAPRAYRGRVTVQPYPRW